MYSTRPDIIQRAIKRLSQVYGTSVQKYSEPVMEVMLEDRLRMLFRYRFWPQWCTWTTVTLTGSNGLHSTDLSTSIDRFVDIQYVFPSGSRRPLPHVPRNLNPYEITGTTPRYIDGEPSTANRIFRVWPLEAEGDLRIRYRTFPELDDLTEIKFDATTLTYALCWDFAVDDGTNPGQAEKFANLYNDSYLDEVSSLNQHGAPLNDSFDVPADWFTP